MFRKIINKIKNRYIDESIVVAENNWWRKTFCCFFNIKYDPKAVNPVYATFKGGYGGLSDDMKSWEYFCLWGHLRFCYNKKVMMDGWQDIKDGWTWISLHGYRDGYTYTPVKKLLWNFTLHIAYRNKWPFIKIGFDNVWPLIYDNGN